MAQCDICNTAGVCSVVKAKDMSKAVRNGFDPFKEGLATSEKVLLDAFGQGKSGTDAWRQSAISGELSLSDWNVCDRCMTVLKTCLDQDTRQGPVSSDEMVDEPIPSGDVDTPEEMDEWLDKWKKELPEVEPAYKPSGTAPLIGMLWMFLAVPVGALSGAIVGGISGGLVGGILGGLPWFLWVRIGLTGCATVFAVIGGIIGLAVGFGMAGATAGAVVAFAGSFGRNRSSKIAATFGIISTLIILCAVWWWVFIGGVGMEVVGQGWTIAALVIGSLIALAAAGVQAAEKVHAKKFCEECNTYLNETKLKKLSYIGTTKTVHALTDHRYDAAISIMKQDNGERGIPIAHICPGCGNGFFELTIMLKTRCKKKENEDSWLVCSMAVDKEQGESLILLKENS